MSRAPTVQGEADRPVADAIEGVPAPGQHERLFGHAEAQAAFDQALASGRLHHAWLLAGPKGIGKATFALALAARLVADDGDSGRARRMIGRGAHPNVLHIARTWDDRTKRFRTQLAVDDVRRTQGFFGMTVAGGERRVCVVDPADELSTGAANALLKILEEPPAGAVFLLVAHAPGRLLPTIRSRCRSLTMRRLADEDVDRAVAHLQPEAAQSEREAAVRAADGAPRQALLALQGDTLKHFAVFEAIAAAALEGRTDWTKAHGLADRLSARQADAEFEQFRDLVFGWISARLSRGDDDPRSLVRWATLWEKARTSLERGRTFNLDRKQLVLDLFAALFEAAGTAPLNSRTR